MSGALDGIRVLDLSRLLPGGFCTGLLADFGADVLKVEDTGLGDYVRWAPPHYEGADPSAAGSTNHVSAPATLSKVRSEARPAHAIGCRSAS